MNSITLATFNSLESAETLKHRLETAGIHAVVYDESRLQRYWFMSAPLAAQKVEVSRRDFETAQELLAVWSRQENALKDAVRCPECGSFRIEYPQFTRKFITPILVEIVSVLRLTPRQFYCEECHFTWPKDEPREQERDLLDWPVSVKKPDASRLPQHQEPRTEIAASEGHGWMHRVKTKISARYRH